MKGTPPTDREIDAAIKDRLGRWGRFLREQHALPSLIVGFTPREGKVVITTCEGMPTQLIINTLAGALELARRGKIEEV